uniref:Uncharacterized protein n=1 Tax=Romanomermis culicivorax TaxID=13658 RepID=A0A915KWZ4_ROMCU
PLGQVSHCTCGSIHRKRKSHLPACSSYNQETGGNWRPDCPSPCVPGHQHNSKCVGGVASQPQMPQVDQDSQHSPRWNHNNGDHNGPHAHRTAIISRMLTDTALTQIQE